MTEKLSSTQKLEERLHHEIPLSTKMGVKIRSIARDHVALEAPLEPNINHKSTAFGGSVHSLAVLSCWALVTSILEHEEMPVSYVVVQDSQIDYLAPISGDFEAVSAWESEGALQKFLSTLKRRGLARVRLTSKVCFKGETCAVLSARFAAQIDKP